MHINIIVNVHLVIKIFNLHDAMFSSYATVRSEQYLLSLVPVLGCALKCLLRCSPEKPVPEVTNRLVDEVMVENFKETSVKGNVTQHTVSAV